MNLSPDHKAPESRASIRTDARLDATTRQKVDELATRFHTPRAAVLGYIVEWGLSRGQTARLTEGEAQGPVRHLYCYVASDLHAQVEKTASAAGVKTAPWLRHMVRQITLTDFPASWQATRSEERSHDSRVYDTRFMLRLDHLTQEKLEALSAHFDLSAAAIIRQLIGQATPEDFPPSWQLRATEHRAKPPRRPRPAST